jgi:hypothetical protein
MSIDLNSNVLVSSRSDHVRSPALRILDTRALFLCQGRLPSRHCAFLLGNFMLSKRCYSSASLALIGELTSRSRGCLAISGKVVHFMWRFCALLAAQHGKSYLQSCRKCGEQARRVAMQKEVIIGNLADCPLYLGLIAGELLLMVGGVPPKHIEMVDTPPCHRMLPVCLSSQ